VDNFGATVLGAVKDARLRLPPLRGAFGIFDRPCAPLPPEDVGTGSVPTIDQPPACRTGSELISKKPPGAVKQPIKRLFRCYAASSSTSAPNGGRRGNGAITAGQYPSGE